MRNDEGYGPLNGRPAPMSVEDLRRILNYNPETGGFTWAVDRGCNAARMKAGSIAGSVKDNGYVAIKINGAFYKAHRLAWYLGTGEWPPADREIDHINRVRGDNRLCNLRVVTKAGNQANAVRTRVAKPKAPKPDGPRKVGRGYERPAPMPIDELRRLLTYERDAGALRWAVDCGGKDAKRIKAGTLIKCRSVQGYVVVRINGVLYPAHRIAYYLETGNWPTPGLVIDHANGIKDDNRWENLRLTTESMNMVNRPASLPNTSGYRGVIRHKGRFCAQIKINGRLKRFPLRITAEEAHADYCEAARVHHGAFARVV